MDNLPRQMDNLAVLKEYFSVLKEYLSGLKEYLSGLKEYLPVLEEYLAVPKDSFRLRMDFRTAQIDSLARVRESFRRRMALPGGSNGRFEKGARSSAASPTHPGPPGLLLNLTDTTRLDAGAWGAALRDDRTRRPTTSRSTGGER